MYSPPKRSRQRYKRVSSIFSLSLSARILPQSTLPLSQSKSSYFVFPSPLSSLPPCLPLPLSFLPPLSLPSPVNQDSHPRLTHLLPSIPTTVSPSSLSPPPFPILLSPPPPFSQPVFSCSLLRPYPSPHPNTAFLSIPQYADILSLHILTAPRRDN